MEIITKKIGHYYYKVKGGSGYHLEFNVITKEAHEIFITMVEMALSDIDKKPKKKQFDYSIDGVKLAFNLSTDDEKKECIELL